MTRLAERVAIVTGGGSGIGAAAATETPMLPTFMGKSGRGI